MVGVAATVSNRESGGELKVCLISHGNMVHVVGRLGFMVERGWDVHWLQIAAGQYEVPGVVVHPLYTSNAMSLSGFQKLGYLRSGFEAGKLLKNLQPDIVWPHYVSSGGLVAWLSGWPKYCVTVHGSDLLERGSSFWGRYLLRRIFSRAEMVNPVASHMIPHIEELGVARADIFAMTHGIPLDAFPFAPGQPDPDGPTRLVCTRTFNSALYDIPTVLSALRILLDDGMNVELLLAATGPLEGDLRLLANKLGIMDHVTFGGGYSRKDLPGILGGSDVYVSSSLWDGTSVSLLEAMACGIVPVVSDIPANSALIKDGRNGLLFRPGDAQGLAGCIRRFRRMDAEETRRWLPANRLLVEEIGDQEMNLDMLMSKIEDIARC